MSENNFQLKLDPKIEYQLELIEARLNALNIANELSLVPNPMTSANMRLQQSLVQAPAKRTTLVPRGKGPSKPRRAEMSDLLKALMGVPAVKNAVDKTKKQAISKLSQGWKNLSPGGKALVISETVLIGGGVLAGILASNSSRGQALEFIQDKSIPVPGIDGLNIQISPVGKEKKIMINFDLTALWK